ncbi:MAG TPA: radical SAM protein [Candidatus Omnitrophota bacterium]|nr:radical SAM protein [Candidatus Omnitrophota bacterium]
MRTRTDKQKVGAQFVSRHDRWNIDGHKLMYHVDRVYRWLNGKTVYPVYLEMGVYGGCNHRCVFCAFDYLAYKPELLEVGFAKKFIREAARRGVKSIMFAGEGEPLLHPRFSDIVASAGDSGIDLAVTTNGVLLEKRMAERILPYLEWLRISLNAGTASTYAGVHRAATADFQKVITNIETAVRIKKKNRLVCVIGVQFLLLAQNYREAPALARLMRSLGVDYFSLKPYSRHPLSGAGPAQDISARAMDFVRQRTSRCETGTFKVILRQDMMQRLSEGKTYDRCLGLPFAAHITAAGDVYPCSVFLGQKDFIMGNINKQSFKQIWEGRKRRAVMELISARGVSGCRAVCRLDAVNRYLWELKHPGPHVNFI